MRRYRPRAAFALAAPVALASYLLASPALAQEPAAEPARPWPQSPAVGADPPLLPAPGAAPARAPDARPVDESMAKIRELEARIAVDEARLKTLESDLGPLRHLKIEGYTQLQYRFERVNAAASPNRVDGRLPPGISSNDAVAKPDGTTTNTNMFRLRRTRFRSTYETDVVRLFLQIDVIPSGGPVSTEGTIARNAEATGIAHWSKNVKTELTGGLFQIPVRDEVLESSMYRPFIERTWASQNLFPTERDLGVHAKTFIHEERLTFDVGILNGQRLGEKLFVLQPDLNGSKDFFARATTKIGPATFSLAGYLGRGQIVDRQLLRLKNYGRVAANIGVEVAHPIFPKLGETKVMAELLFGTNMDTGVNYPFAVPAIPNVFTSDVRNLHQRAFYLRAEQELTRWGLAGFRFDTYTPESAIENNGRDTYTLMGAARFSKYLRLVNEFSYAIDNIHPDSTPAPSRHIFAYTAWMQGSFY